MFTWLIQFPLLLLAAFPTINLCLCGKNATQQGAAA
jgi:hypothetical protein